MVVLGGEDVSNNECGGAGLRKERERRKSPGGEGTGGGLARLDREGRKGQDGMG